MLTFLSVYLSANLSIIMYAHDLVITNMPTPFRENDSQTPADIPSQLLHKFTIVGTIVANIFRDAIIFRKILAKIVDNNHYLQSANIQKNMRFILII